MRLAGAGMASAVALLAPGCGPTPPEAPLQADPVRRASFRSLAARDFLASCPGGAARPETLNQLERLEELQQLAYRTGAARAVALGESDWAALSRYDERRGCAPGEAAYGEALTAFGATLDELARRIAEHAQ